MKTGAHTNWGAYGTRGGPQVRESAKVMRSVTKDAKLFAAATSDQELDNAFYCAKPVLIWIYSYPWLLGPALPCQQSCAFSEVYDENGCSGARHPKDYRHIG